MSIDGVTVQRLAEKLQRRQLRAGAGTARRRRCGRRAQHRLRRRRLSSSTSPTVRRRQSPIELQNVQAGGQTHVRLPVRVGAGAKATIVERQTGTGDGAGQLGQPSSARRRCRDRLDHRPGPAGRRDASRPVQRIARQERQADAVRHECRRQAGAPGDPRHGDRRGRRPSRCAASTCLPATPIPTSPWLLDHTAPHTTSTEVIRNVVTGRAHGVFQGRINVHQEAQKTDAKMACNTLLLSDDGEFSTKPELEIFADDVQCGHGATVTEIDQQPSVLPDGARHRREDGARPAGQGIRRRGHRGTGRRADRRGAGRRCSTNGSPRMGEAMNAPARYRRTATTSRRSAATSRSCRARSTASRWSISTTAPRRRSRRPCSTRSTMPIRRNMPTCIAACISCRMPRPTPMKRRARRCGAS